VSDGEIKFDFAYKMGNYSDLNLKFILGPSYLYTSFTNNDKED